MDSSPIKRALISVSDKFGLTGFARALADAGVEIYSTGGTARCLRDEGIDVREVSAYTGFPEMMGGRLKTLHPRSSACLAETLVTLSQHLSSARNRQ